MDKEVSYEEKLDICDRMKALDQFQMGHVVKLIEENCSEGIKQSEESENRYQIILDNFTRIINTKIIKYSNKYLTKTESGYKKKQSKSTRSRKK